MNSTSRQFSKPTRQAIAAFMVMWLSGVVFLFCCGAAMQAQAAEEFCPLSKAQSHCDKTKGKSDAPTFSKTDNQTFDCCGFIPKVFDKARKIEKVEKTAKVSDKVKLDLPQASFVKNAFEISRVYRPPISPTEKVFIKNCVFRI